MATTSIWRVNGWLGKVLIYIENPDKTENPAAYEKQGMDGKEIGKRGDRHNFRSGIALETQNFPDAPNHDNFPSSVLRPGETYTQHTVYAFETDKR